MALNTRTPIQVTFASDHSSKLVTEDDTLVVSDDVWKKLQQQALATAEPRALFQGDSFQSDPVKCLGISLRFTAQRFLPPVPSHANGERTFAKGAARDDRILLATLDSDLPPSSFAFSSKFKDRSLARIVSSKSCSVSFTRIPMLEEIFLSTFVNTWSSPADDIQTWLTQSKRIIRQGQTLNTADGTKFSVLMCEPVMQGTISSQTRVITINSQSEEPGSSRSSISGSVSDATLDEDEGFSIDEGFLGGSAFAKHSLEFELRALEGPSGLEAVEDEERQIYVTTQDLGRIGLFDGDWAVASLVNGSSRRLVQLTSLGEIEPITSNPVAFCSPVLIHNMNPPSTSANGSHISLHPSPSPRIPTASTAIIARVASPQATNRAYQPLFLRALKQHFQDQKRLVREGDLIAVPIWEEQLRLLPSEMDKDKEDERREAESDKSDELLDHAFPWTSSSPSSVVYFKVTNLEYEVLKPDSSDHSNIRIDEDYIAASTGELGCFIDPETTKLIQTGLERSRIPDAGLYCGVPPNSYTRTSAFSKLHEIVGACLYPGAEDYDLPISVLLKGSKGVGKATVVRSVSMEAGIHCYEIDCYDVLGETDVQTQGTLTARFEHASECSPCIFLIKNLEALARNSQALESGRDPSIVPILRECLNGLRGSWKFSGHPVILVATTTVPDQIPLAALAFFKHDIGLEVPEESERLHILEKALDGECIAPDVSLKEIASQTAALVAEDLTGLVDRARLACLGRANDARPSGVEYEDLQAAGIQLTAADFDTALSATRTSFSESIGAPKIPNVTWDDVGGLESVKQDILDTVQLPLEHPELFVDGLKKRSGILLYGPPGTGKTLLAKAVATSCSLNFLSVKGPELLNMYIGESEANVRRVFQRARDAKPCVIFFDELDSVAPKRGNQGDSGGVMDRIVSQLLAELDGMSGGKGAGASNIFVIGATNRPDLLDPALLRPGRFDKMLYLGVSTTHHAQLNIIQALTRKFRLDPALDLADVAAGCPFNYTGADLYALCSDAMLKAMSRLAEGIDEKIAVLNSQPSDNLHPTPITPQYYLAEMATDAETEVVVSGKDFTNAMKELVPSVSASEIDHYAEVQRRFAKETLNSKLNGSGESKPKQISVAKGKGKVT